MIYFGFLSIDLIILLVLFAFTFFVAFKKSKNIVARFIIPFYVTTFIYSALPFETTEAASQVLMFFVTYGVLVFLMKKSITSTTGNGDFRHFIDSAILSFAAIFSLFIAYYKVIPIDGLIKINFPFSAFILENIPYYVLIMIPLVLIYISNAFKE
jgi:hypothetical protein